MYEVTPRQLHAEAKKTTFNESLMSQGRAPQTAQKTITQCNRAVAAERDTRTESSSNFVAIVSRHQT